MNDVKYPDITVQLIGMDGNAFAVLGRMERAMREAGIGPNERADFRTEATAGDYDHLLATCKAWVDVQ